MEERLPAVHPGEVLLEEYLRPLSLTPYRLSKSIGVPQTRIAAILQGRRGITADTARRLARFFGNSPEFWLNLQSRYELLEAERAGGDLRDIEPLPRSVELTGVH